MDNISAAKPKKVAIPYYAALLLPRKGLSQIYFIAEVDLAQRVACQIEMRVWQGRPHNP